MRMNYFKLKFLLLFFALAVTIPPAWAETVTVHKTVNELTEANGWTVSSGSTINGLYTNFNLDDNINISTTGEPNCGAIFGTTIYDWRLYYNEGGNIIVSANNGCTLKSIKLTFNVSNGGSLSGVTSGNENSVNGTNVTYNVTRSGTKNGQVRITEFSVTYETGGVTPVLEDVSLSFPQSSYTATLGEAFTAPTLSVDPAGAASEVTYSSSNTGVATVANDGTVTLVGAGTTTITASFAGNDEYNAATASYTLTVIESLPEGVIFYESFNKCDGNGGNDEQWGGNIGAKAWQEEYGDNPGWVMGNAYAYAANKCIRLSKSGNMCGATTPSITVKPGSTYTLTFKAGPWTGDKETLEITPTGGVLDQTLVTMVEGCWTTYSLTFTANSNSTTATFKFRGILNEDGNHRFFLDEVKLQEGGDVTPTDDPTIEVDQTQLTINDKDENNTFTVTGSNLIDNVGVTASEGFSTNVTYLENNSGSAEGTVKVTYTGRDLYAEGTVVMGTDKDDTGEDITETVNVTYQPDIYLYGDLSDNNHDDWGDIADGKMERNGDVYSKTITLNEKGFLLFARKTGETYGWDKNRLFFGPKTTDGNNWLYVADKEDDLDLDPSGQYHPFELPAGEYTITINAETKKFNIAKTEPINACPAVIEFKDNDSDGTDDLFASESASFSDAVSSGSAYIESALGSKVYQGATGLKFSSSKVNGGLTINLKNLNGNGSWKTTQVIVNAKSWTNNQGNTDEAAVSVNNQTAQSTTAEFADYTFNLDGSEISQIEINATKRLYVKSITIMHECGDEPVIETVATPTFEPEPQEEAFTTVQNVTITCATVDAAIHYTTDGSEPTAESAVYSEPIVVNDGTTTIKAIAMKEGMTNSEVASATYTVNLPTLDAPTFDHESNIYDDAFEVTIVAAEGATIHYTTDGNEPTAESAVYKDRIPVNKNMTIKAIAVKEGYKTSAVATAEYQIKVAKPTFSPVPGTFDAATQVSIVCGTEGATIHYTTDGTTEPTAESPVYSQPIAVNSGTMTIKAIAIKKDMTNSDIAEGVYTIKQNAGLAFDPTTATAEAGAEEFNAPTLVNPNNLSPITYKSSDENVAAFVDGVLVIGDAGETTITATFAGNEEFNEGSASYTLTVTKKDAGLKYEQAELTVYAGNDFTAPTLVNPNKLSPITYSSNNENVAMVDEETGEVVLMDEIGNATITATFAGNGQYNEATASYTIHVIAKKTATLTFDPTQVTVYVGTEEITQPTLTTNPNNLSPITYSSDNENVAMVDDKTGEVVLMDEIGNAKITATFAGNDEYAKAEASYTITVEAKPAIIVDFESLTMAAKVGETATATFNVLGTDLKEVVTLTLNDANGVYTINPESNISIKDAEEGATVTVTYKPTAAGSHEATISVTTKDAETATVTLAGTATVPEVVAMPTFSLVAGSYTGAQQVTIYCATERATISYSTDGGNTWTVGNTVNVDKDMTIMAKAEKDGMTVSTTASATYVIITEEAPVPVNIETGYYQIKNLGNGLYANVAGRKTLNFTDEPADKAGTVIYVDVENDGTVKSLRSQAADLQRYADRAMSYVPEVVKIVAQKLNADGSGEILGETGLNKILDKFNECFDHNLHVEQAEGGYRLYGKTPSMQPVVEFYRENKDKVEAKLPNLEAFINSALEKLKAKIGGSSVFTEFKLHDIWDKMGGTLTEPVDAASTMAFYREVLNNKNYVWDFAYQTAMIYVNNLMNHPRWSEVEEQLGEYAQYIDKIKQIRPEFKYYIVQKDGKPDFISEGNKDIIDNAERTIWTLEPRTDFTVNFPEANKHNGEYVTTLYTDFAYTLPEGVTAYAVTEVSTQGVATLTALEGTIPAQTPVLLKSTAYGAQTVTLSTEAGTAPADNLLVGPDYLIKTYEIKTPQVEKIFEIIQNKLPGFYEEYVAQYEYLMLKTAGTVGNKYFWGLNKDEIIFDNNCVVRSLDVQDGTVAFYDNATVSINKAFLVDDANNPQEVIKLSLRGDINKDGVISIIDVTALIDILLDLPARNYLEPTTSYPKGLDYEAADVNENKDIEITDVTTLIDILLNMPDQPAQGSGN